MSINIVQSGSLFAVSATGSFAAQWVSGSVVSVSFPTFGLFDPATLYFPVIQKPVTSTISEPTVSGSFLYVNSMLIGPYSGEYLTYGQFLFIFPIPGIEMAAEALLQTNNAFQPVFQPLPVNDQLFYDEGPRLINNKKPSHTDRATSLGNLTSSFPYVQGVEMNKQAMYDQGIVKIWSGDPGHQLKPCVFGQSDDCSFNGVIEPFSIRPIVFFLTGALFGAHEPRAGLSDGNDDLFYGNDRILTVDYYSPSAMVTPFADQVDILNPGTVMSGTWSSGSWTGPAPYQGTWLGQGTFTPIDVPVGVPLNNEYYQFDFATIIPYVDQALNRNATPNDVDEPADMVRALAHMVGSTNNYIRYDERSATCGWSYDNTVTVGTDSLAFGGMTY
jgi:hypothetical protein